MNVENILKVANAIEGGTIKHFDFNMKEIAETNGCGTTACIAGYALALKDGQFKSGHHISPSDLAAQAGAFLGLTQDKYDPLFFPDSDGGPTGEGWFKDHFELADIPKEKAVAVLRHLAETGEVEWAISTSKDTKGSHE